LLKAKSDSQSVALPALTKFIDDSLLVTLENVGHAGMDALTGLLMWAASPAKGKRSIAG